VANQQTLGVTTIAYPPGNKLLEENETSSEEENKTSTEDNRNEPGEDQ
jgi:hypothetical protein